MGKHEIRLRRQQMTSRRIQSHKNYAELLKSHEKASRFKKLMRLLYILLFMLTMVGVAYIAIDKLNEKPQKQEVIDPGAVEEIKINYADPKKH